MYRHLCVALDGSHNARPALIEAVRIAAWSRAGLTLLHVVSLHDFSVDSVGMVDSRQLHDSARRHGQHVLDEAMAYASRQGIVQLDGQLLEAPQGGEAAADALVAAAVGGGADLLVMGTHGHRGWKHLLLGSFAESVLRRTPVPLLVVRNPEDDDTPAATVG